MTLLSGGGTQMQGLQSQCAHRSSGMWSFKLQFWLRMPGLSLSLSRSFGRFLAIFNSCIPALGLLHRSLLACACVVLMASLGCRLCS